MAIPLIFLFRNPKVMWLSLRNACVLSLQLCLTLCDPTDCRGGSCVHGILQARIPEWVAISSSRGSSRWNTGMDTGMDPVSVTCPALAGGFFTIAPPGKPSLCWYRLQGYPF